MTDHTNIQSLRSKLAAVRAAVICWLAVDGLAWLTSGIAAMVVVSLAVDRYFRMDQPQRRVMLVLMLVGLAALGVAIYRRVIRPLAGSVGDRVLSMQIERRHPELGDALVTAVELSDLVHARRQHASPALTRAAIDHGIRRVADMRFLDVVDFGTMARKAAVVFLAVGSVVGACLFAPDVMGLWARRNLLIADVAWPQRTHLHLVGLNDAGELVVPRGDDLELRAVADPNGVVPAVVHLDHAPARGRRHTESMRNVGSNAFVSTFPNVLDAFAGRLRVRGGDAVSPWHEVRLVNRPAVEQLTLRVEPPAYTDQPPSELPAGQGAYPVLAGSTLRVLGTTNNPIAEARLTHGSATLKPLAVDPNDPRRVHATLDPNELDNGSFGIVLFDRSGLRSRRPARFTLRIDADQTPQVRARLEGVGDMVTTDARLPLAVRLRDDYAIVNAGLTYELAAAAGDDADPNGGTTRSEPVTLQLDAIDAELPGRDFDWFEHVFDLRGRELPTDAHLNFVIEATDNDTVSGPKTGRSITFAVKIVTEREFRGELLRLETEQRLEFERLRKDQRQVLVETRALAAELPDAERLAPDQRAALDGLEKSQRLLVGRCEQVGVQFRRILDQVINNRVEREGGPMRTRLRDGIVEPVLALASSGIPSAADALDAATVAQATAADRRGRLADAAAQQAAILERMDAILAAMVKMEGFQEAVNLLREILNEQQTIREQTAEELEKQIESIFED